MTRPHRPAPLPLRDGVSASCVVIPQDHGPTLLDFLAARFPLVNRRDWQARMDRGEVCNDLGEPVQAAQSARPGLRLHYYREVPDEPVVPFEARVLYRDEHLLVADKPHFLAVTPSGRHLRQTLLVRLKQATGLADLSPVHRIDRETAGLVMFSVQAPTRGAYQALFRDHRVHKVYEAIAPWKEGLSWPQQRRSRITQGPEFFRQQECAGEVNAVTDMDVIEVRGKLARYRLCPVTGQTHQLRVHMAALGLPLVNDLFYPRVVNGPAEPDDYQKPLKLLAQSLRFDDPVSGQARNFETQQTLSWPDGPEIRP